VETITFAVAFGTWTIIVVAFLVGKFFRQRPEIVAYIVASWVAGFAFAYAIIYGLQLYGGG
jgi:hypothetical protein